MANKKARIRLDVQFDEHQVPESISWNSDDMEKQMDCKAFFLCTYEAKEQSTYRMDMWTKEMRIDEMKQFVFDQLYTLGDVYHRATQDVATKQMIQDFARHFGKLNEIIKESDTK